MKLFSALSLNRAAAAATQPPEAQLDSEKNGPATTDIATPSSPVSDAEGNKGVSIPLEELPEPELQDGVKKAEVVTLLWSENSLILLYTW